MHTHMCTHTHTRAREYEYRGKATTNDIGWKQHLEGVERRSERYIGLNFLSYLPPAVLLGNNSDSTK